MNEAGSGDPSTWRRKGRMEKALGLKSWSPDCFLPDDQDTVSPSPGPLSFWGQDCSSLP
jgi:hypothetical protein